MTRMRYGWLALLVLCIGMLPTVAQETISEDLRPPAFTCEEIVFPVTTVQEMSDSIIAANDETLCPGPDVIDMSGNFIIINDRFGSTFSGLPEIASDITIQNGDIYRNKENLANIFRLFFVTTASTSTGNLTLDNMRLRYGISPLSGGAVFVDSGTSATIINSTLDSNFSRDEGGSIYVTNGTLNIYNSEILGSDSDLGDNTTIGTDGGGIFAENSNVTIRDSVLRDNRSGNRGGALTAIGSNISISNTTFRENIAKTYGGAISIREGSMLSIADSTFNGNLSTDEDGGAVAIGLPSVSGNPSDAYIVRSDFVFNWAQGDDGGAITVNNSSTLTLINSTVEANRANDRAGGIYNIGGTSDITNVLIAGNIAAGEGGGLWSAQDSNNAGDNLELTNVTLAGNQAAAGGGYYHNSGDADIDNSIIWGNSSSIGITTAGSVGVNSSIVEGGLPTGVTDESQNLTSDPQFVLERAASAAPDNIGDYRLYSDSPAINQGNNLNIGGGRRIADIDSDLLGDKRIQDNIVDMGAYETNVPRFTRTNLISNPNFDNGLTNWGFFGQGSSSSVNNEGRFYRDPGFKGATLLQQGTDVIPAGTDIEVEVDLGNASNVAKGLEVVFRTPNFQDSISCSVTIPAGSDLQTVTVRGITDIEWNGWFFGLRSYDPDGIPAIRVDNVDVRAEPSSNIDGFTCDGFAAPGSVNLLKNGDFSTGLRYWTFFGDFDFQINSGVMNFWNTSGATQPAVLFQDQIGYHFSPGTPLRFDFSIGNNSVHPKNVEIFLRDANFAQSRRCDYTIPANTPLSPVTIRLETDAEWTRPIVLFRTNDADGDPAVRVDNVSLRYLPSQPATTLRCPSITFANNVGQKDPTILKPDNGIMPDTGGAAPAPIAPPNPGGIPEIPGF